MDKHVDEILWFENERVKLEVNMQDETVWLNQKQMANLFGKNTDTIGVHIRNIFNEGELNKDSVTEYFSVTAKDSKTYRVLHYNLDVIISVGYRVKSKEGTQFRQWANQVLKDYLLKGISINQKRLNYLEKTVKLIDIAVRLDDNIQNEESYHMMRVISDYSKALETLDRYDHKIILQSKEKNEYKSKISYDNCSVIIREMIQKEQSKLFGREKEIALSSIIENIYLTYDGKDVYPSLKEKACHFLYFIVKDHVFVDGNKRIGGTLFLYFLDYYQILYHQQRKIIEPSTLVAAILFVAQSNPSEKEVVIDLLLNIMQEL